MIEFAEDIDDLENLSLDQINQHIDANTIYLKKGTLNYKKTTDVVLFCVIKNGEFYLPKFLNHYLNNLKVNHIYFLDNGSTDNTVQICSNYDNVTVQRTNLPFKVFRKAFREYQLEKFGKNKWCMVLDIDEFFDYPYSQFVPLSNFIEYLQVYKYEAVVTQMLDMFPKGDVLQLSDESFNNFTETHAYYDISNVRKERYWDKRLNNNFTNRAIRLHFGGIRQKVFNLESVLLSKHTLVYYHSEMEYEHIHWVKNAKVADVSAVILHFKYHNKFLNHVKEAVELEHYHAGSKEYKQYFNKIKDDGKLFLSTEKSQKYNSINELLYNYFLFVSLNYIKYCRNVELKRKYPPEKNNIKAKNINQLFNYSNFLLENKIKELNNNK